MGDTTFSYFLPQLVQAIKFENHHVSPLAMLLIERAIKNPNQIGFDLFWSMKVEAHNDQYRERYGTILNAYLDVCSSKMRAILKLQDKLFSEGGMLERICQSVKAKKKDGAAEMKRAMQQGLEALNELLPGSFQLPLDPRIEVGKIIVSKCRVMDSAKKPLWLVFENAEEGGDPVTVMFKAGDDVRQDCLTLQLIRLMDEMWRDEGLDLAMEPYKCVATSPMTGILQMVPNSVTTAEVHRRDGMMGTFKDPSFSDWIRANNPDPRSHKAAVDLFGRSCAGYCVATCVLGIGDRHNDNIMIASSGRYFHIDFGHFLGHLKYYKLGIRRERTPFVFTNEMAYVLGGVEGKDFAKFVDTAFSFRCVRAPLMQISRRDSGPQPVMSSLPSTFTVAFPGTLGGLFLISCLVSFYCATPFVGLMKITIVLGLILSVSQITQFVVCLSESQSHKRLSPVLSPIGGSRKAVAAVGNELLFHLTVDRIEVIEADQDKEPALSETASPVSDIDGITESETNAISGGPIAFSPRFIAGEKGDEEKGRARYLATLEWRKENNIDNILVTPHPNFETIKKYYPQYFHGRTRDGLPVYYERPGKIDLPALKREGLSIDDLLRHYMYITEYLWRVVEPNDSGRSITVLDVTGIGMYDLGGEVLDFIKRASAFTGAHYPERSAHIFIINIPGWFNMIWRMVKPMIDPVTREKVRH
ncbi:Adenylate cyclase [Phytophthora nicotianae]|uniref:phosphatidylinositol 3-kinase n=1 Tax=Phytophthora nicotianae TaxID=4792 RepID=A0A0W8DS76_PHYNI|nr:Adenylate cyclase [Phytophthora nicotianae]